MADALDYLHSKVEVGATIIHRGESYIDSNTELNSIVNICDY